MDTTNFLSTGIIENIQVGVKLVEIKSHLSKSTLNKKNFYDNDNKDDYSIFHEGIEIMVVDGLVHGMIIDLNRNTFTILDRYELSNKMSFETLVHFLDFANVNWEFYSPYCLNRELCIKTEGGVYIGAVFDKSGYWITKFQKFYENR